MSMEKLDVGLLQAEWLPHGPFIILRLGPRDAVVGYRLSVHEARALAKWIEDTWPVATMPEPPR